MGQLEGEGIVLTTETLALMCERAGWVGGMDCAETVRWCLVSLAGPLPSWAWLCLVLVIAGAAGGAANYLLIPQVDPENKKPFLAFILSGIIVSTAYPVRTGIYHM
jgi:hypothetical protein